jgi:hypothetical protein
MAVVRRLLLVALAGMLPRAAEAQSAQPVSVQASGLFNGVFGNLFQDLQDGFGGEAQIRYTPGALSFGAGFQYTSHAFRGRTERARLYGGFIEPRYRIHAGSNVAAPYISARFSLLKVGISGGDLSLTSNFIQLNGGGGLLVRLGPRINLDLGVTYGFDRLSAGEFRSASTGASVPVESSSGANAMIRVGLAVGIGG